MHCDGSGVCKVERGSRHVVVSPFERVGPWQVESKTRTSAQIATVKMDGIREAVAIFIAMQFRVYAHRVQTGLESQAI